jgi:hypothetical protein
MFPGFDGLMTLSRREGVDIRPTLLRVLTDLYVQSPRHTDDEERQFIELTSRLIDEVDDATRAAVRARLSIYSNTPAAIAAKLGLQPAIPNQRIPVTRGVVPEPTSAPSAPTQVPAKPSTMSMQTSDASELTAMFFAATGVERARMLHGLADSPLRPSARIPEARAARAMHILEMAAFAEDRDNFARELGEALTLATPTAQQIVTDPGGEPLACALKALGMSSAIFQRVLLFLNPDVGASVKDVYRLARMYDVLSERAALIMIAAWRGATVAQTRAKYRPALYDDERQRARPAATQTKPATQQPGIDVTRPTRTTGK